MNGGTIVDVDGAIMNATPLFDTFLMMFAIGLVLNIGTLVTILVMNALGDRRTTLPRAIARQV